VPGASVTATSVLTNQSSDAATDDAGYYRVMSQLRIDSIAETFAASVI